LAATHESVRRIITFHAQEWLIVRSSKTESCFAGNMLTLLRTK